MWNRLVPHGTTENSMSVSSPEYLRADLQKLNRDMAILKKVTPTLFWTTSQMTFFDTFLQKCLFACDMWSFSYVLWYMYTGHPAPRHELHEPVCTMCLQEKVATNI